MAVSKASRRTQSIALPPVGAKCQECRDGALVYIACGAPAIRIVTKDRETYTMCEMHAHHAVKNRGFRFVMAGEDYKITPIPTAASTPIPSPAGKAAGGKPASPTRAGKPPAATPKRNAQKPAEMIDEEFADLPPTGDKLDLIRKLASDQIKLKSEIADLAQKITDKQAALKTNEEVLMVNALLDAGIDSFTTDDGFHISMREIINASIPSHLKEPAYEYLEAENAGNLIKRTVQINIGKDDAYKLLMKQVEAFLKKLNKGRKHPIDYETKMAVHGNTLTAWVKERMKQDNPVDEKLLGVFRLKKAEVSQPKKKERDTDIPV